MNILFLLSCLEPSGSETYCVSLAQAWKGRHTIFWISDLLHYGQDYTSMPIHLKAFPVGFVNAYRVAAYVRKHKIDIIHSHSRRAHWVAAQVSQLTGVPYVTTVHQPMPVHFFSKTFPCLGHQTIAIDEVVADQLMSVFRVPPGQMHLVRNGIALSAYLPTQRQASAVKRILLIGRLSGGRWPALQFFLDVLAKIAPTLPPAHYNIVGRIPDERRSLLIHQLSILNSKIAPCRVEALGYISDIGTLVRNSDGVIASGRSALESLAGGRSVILLGEGGVIGLAKPDHWPTALRTNLGDHLGPKQFVPAVMELALRELLSPRADVSDLHRWGREQVEKHYSLAKIAPEIEQVYQQCFRS